VMKEETMKQKKGEVLSGKKNKTINTSPSRLVQ